MQLKKRLRLLDSANVLHGVIPPDARSGSRQALALAISTALLITVSGGAQANVFPAEVNLASLDGSSGFALNGEAEFDHSGFSVSAAGDFNGDGIDDLIIGARRADPNGINSGRSYVVFGSISERASPFNLSSLNGANGFMVNGEAANDESGVSVSAAGDVNGDGIDDLIIGAWNAGPNGTDSGRSYVVFGRRDGIFSDRFQVETARSAD